jgi:hypothetical protein
VLNLLENEELTKRLVASATLDLTPEGRKKALEDCLNLMKKKRLERKLDLLRQGIALAEKKGDPAQVMAYTREYQALLQQNKL